MLEQGSPPDLRREEANLPSLECRIRIVYFFTVVALLFWLAAIFLAPYLKSRGSPWQVVIYALFSPVCHQIPARCFYLSGHPLAVCTRCLGVYVGSLIGLGLYPWVRRFGRLELPRIRCLMLLSAPILVDTLGNFVKLWASPNLARFGTGLIWGPILPFYFVTGIAELVNALSQKPAQKSQAGAKK